MEASPAKRAIYATLTSFLSAARRSARDGSGDSAAVSGGISSVRPRARPAPLLAARLMRSSYASIRADMESLWDAQSAWGATRVLIQTSTAQLATTRTASPQQTVSSAPAVSRVITCPSVLPDCHYVNRNRPRPPTYCANGRPTGTRYRGPPACECYNHPPHSPGLGRPGSGPQGPHLRSSSGRPRSRGARERIRCAG